MIGLQQTETGRILSQQTVVGGDPVISLPVFCDPTYLRPPQPGHQFFDGVVPETVGCHVPFRKTVIGPQQIFVPVNIGCVSFPGHQGILIVRERSDVHEGHVLRQQTGQPGAKGGYPDGIILGDKNIVDAVAGDRRGLVHPVVQMVFNLKILIQDEYPVAIGGDPVIIMYFLNIQDLLMIVERDHLHFGFPVPDIQPSVVRCCEQDPVCLPEQRDRFPFQQCCVLSGQPQPSLSGGKPETLLSYQISIDLFVDRSPGCSPLSDLHKVFTQ